MGKEFDFLGLENNRRGASGKNGLELVGGFSRPGEERPFDFCINQKGRGGRYGKYFFFLSGGEGTLSECRVLPAQANGKSFE